MFHNVSDVTRHPQVLYLYNDKLLNWIYRIERISRKQRFLTVSTIVAVDFEFSSIIFDNLKGLIAYLSANGL